MEQLRKLKATPVPMPLGEVLPALQQGTIDGVMSVLPVLTAFRYYDAAKYILESEQAMVSVVTVLSKIWYDNLPPDLQTILADAGRRASVEVFPWAVEFIAKQRQVWTANGGELVQLSTTEHAELNKLLKPIGAEVFPWAVEFIAKQRQVWTANGGELVQLSPAEHAELNKLLKPVGAEVTSNKPEEAALYALLQKTAEKIA